MSFHDRAHHPTQHQASRADAAPLVGINDSTLRDGEQAPGVSFTIDEKLAIAEALQRAGVDEIEAGTPAMGDVEIEALCAIGHTIRRSAVIAWCRMTERDVTATLRTGLRRASLSVPMSARQMRAKGYDGPRDVLARIAHVVGYARANGLTVAVGGEDSSRAEPDVIAAVLEAAQRAGAHRFRYADTLGILDPFATQAAFARMRALTDLELEFHGHDDLGLATANTLAAVRGGATHVSVCALGLGERAGNAALEQVAVAMRRTGLGQCGIDFAALPALAAIVAGAAGRAIPPAQPIVGGAVFSHESGIHVSGLDAALGAGVHGDLRGARSGAVRPYQADCSGQAFGHRGDPPRPGRARRGGERRAGEGGAGSRAHPCRTSEARGAARGIAGIPRGTFRLNLGGSHAHPSDPPD